MHKKLIQEAFKKAEEILNENGDNNPSKTNLAEEISDYLDEQCNCQISSKRLEQYYNSADKIKKKKEDIKIKQITVVFGLCDYLGFSSYKEFKRSIATKREKIKFFFTKNKQALIISLVTILISLGITFTRGQRWMIWQEHRYVEVSFDLTKYNYDQLEIHDAEKMRTFKKIESPNCNTQYFSEKGKPITWYWKRGKNDLEIFISPGLHPINGKTLKPITKYMIREHICEHY